MPKLKESIAPCFETARYFLIVNVREGREISSSIVNGTGCEGFGQVRLLQDHNVDTLICGGIKSFYKQLLISCGINVIESVDVPFDDALSLYLDGELEPSEAEETLPELSVEIPHEDLVCWATELFESHGYRILKTEMERAFPIDLVAEINCPVCHRPIRVAVCCGAHTYRSDQEIQEFHHVTRSSFQARVYVYPARSSVRRCCCDYGIQVLDPDADALNRDHVEPGRIPLLEQPIAGHERAFAPGGSE